MKGNKIFFVFVLLTFFISCQRKHYTRKHPWQPKRVKHLKHKYERCYYPNSEKAYFIKKIYKISGGFKTPF